MMRVSKKAVVDILIPTVLLCIGLLSYTVIPRVEWIPVVNNVFVLMAYGGFLSGSILFVRTIGKNIEIPAIKIFLVTVLIVGIAVGVFVGLLIAAFSWKTDWSFRYQDKIYYYQDVGWFDPKFEVYEKDGSFTMKKIQVYYVSIPADADEITDEMAEEIVSGTYENSEIDRRKAEKDASTEDLRQKFSSEETKWIDKDPQKFLEEHVLSEDVIAIPDSSFGMVSVDHAMARNRWFFVQTIDDRLIYISELPQTDPSVEGYVDAEGTIYLEFRDLESNFSKYQSTDGGLHWEKIPNGEKGY